jgi:hypothetical protein
MQLTVPDGSSVSSLSYTISGGPTAKSGTIDVSKSNTISAVIGGLAAGSGYMISLSGTSDGGDACTGSAGPFTVKPNATLSLSLVVACHKPRANGSITVGGTVDVCPGIDAINAVPSEVTVGNDVAISASASPDETALGSPLVYTWTGVTTSDTKGNAIFHCASSGTFPIAVSVGNGDSACNTPPDPAASATVNVTCDASQVGVPDASVGAPDGAQSTSVVINFDSIDASAAPVQGAAVNTYLASFGVSVTAAPDVGLDIQQAPFWEPTSSPPNFLNAFGSNATLNTGVTYTLTFSGPMASVSFFRTGIQAGSTMGLWTATAYSASNQALSTVGENSIVTNVPPQQFVLSGPAIAWVVFFSNVEGFAGTYLSIDDLTLNP